MWPLYYAGMYFFVLGIRAASFFNSKAAQWIEGRRKWKDEVSKLPPKKNYRIWFHVSSLGEFEQSRPVIDQLKERSPEIEIILTFFSPSGYTFRKNYAGADKVMYLPADLPANAAFWVKNVAPDLAVFVKYDLWPGYLFALKNNAIPAILIAAHFSSQKGFSSAFNPLTKKFLPHFKAIFTQRDERASFPLLNMKHAGDPRIDRVLKLPAEASDKIPEWLKNLSPFDIVAGSIWKEDEEILIPVIEQLGLSAILVPHDVSGSNIDRLTGTLRMSYILLSRMNQDADSTANIIIVDSVGLLGYLYALGKIAYIGGGFGKGIHNILEPIAHGRPVLFGPKYHSFPEATDAVREGFGFSVESTVAAEKRLNALLKGGEHVRTGQMAKEYLIRMSGASSIISDYILNSIHSPTK